MGRPLKTGRPDEKKPVFVDAGWLPRLEKYLNDPADTKPERTASGKTCTWDKCGVGDFTGRLGEMDKQGSVLFDRFPLPGRDKAGRGGPVNATRGGDAGG